MESASFSFSEPVWYNPCSKKGKGFPMVIDIHTHTFPPQLAPRALSLLSQNARACFYADGTTQSLHHSMLQAGINVSVIQPVVTAARQTESINRTACQLCQTFSKTGILSFGGIHPDTPHPRAVLRGLKEAGVPGIKLHPAYQNTPFDDSRYLRILEAAGDYGLLVLVHGGLDVGCPGNDCASPYHIRRALSQVCPPGLILAHMGAWQGWNEAEELVDTFPVYVDTAYTLGKIQAPPQAPRRPEECTLLPDARFVQLVRRWGAHRVLFGTDSPWMDQQEQLCRIRDLPLTPQEQAQILGQNAAKLLGWEESVCKTN